MIGFQRSKKSRRKKPGPGRFPKDRDQVTMQMQINQLAVGRQKFETLHFSGAWERTIDRPQWVSHAYATDVWAKNLRSKVLKLVDVIQWDIPRSTTDCQPLKNNCPGAITQSTHTKWQLSYAKLHIKKRT